MAVIGVKYSTIVDIANSMDPDGSVAGVAELLAQTNEILTDMPAVEGNLPTGHQVTIRTGLPEPTWRKFYGGVPASKSQRARVTETCGMLEARNEIDKDEADLNGNTASFRLSEATAEVEGMNQTMASSLFYSDTTINPERIHGMAPRYNALTGAGNSQNVLSGEGGAADNTSIWLIGWHPQTIFSVFPKGSKAGLMHQDLGEIDAFDADNNRFRAYADRWQWKIGLCVKDWRYAVRICNIDVGDLISGTNAADIIELMIRAKHRIPYLSMCKPVFYCNRTVREMLDIQALRKSSQALAIKEAAEQFQTSLLGIPIKTVDALLNTEAAVS